MNVDPGSYTVSEASLLTNYTASGWSGACAANGSVTIAPGQNLVCNITNNDNPPLLRVVKALLSGDTGRFDLQIDGSPPNSGSVNVGDGSTGFVPVKGGVAHTVSEAGNSTNLADYVVTIGGACASDGTITPVSGNNSYTCAITNTRKGLQPPDVSQARPERRYTVAA